MFFGRKKQETNSEDFNYLLNELSKVSLFYDINPEDLYSVAKFMQVRVFSANQYVFYENDVQNEMYIILEGTVRILKKNKRGSDDTLAEYGPPNIFGELALITPGKRSASVLAVTDLVLAEFSCDKFNKLAEIDPKAAICILKKIAETLNTRLRRINTAYMELSSKLS